MIWCPSQSSKDKDISSTPLVLDHSWYVLLNGKFFYSYNYNLFTQNVRYRTFRNFFPFVVAALFGSAYSDYKQQVLKVNLFDEYCWLRSQELVKQNEYLLQHEGKFWVSKTLSDSFGGKRTWERRSERWPDRQTTTMQVTSRTQNWFCKTLSTGTSTHQPNHPWTSSPLSCLFEPEWSVRNKYIHSFSFLHLYPLNRPIKSIQIYAID